MDAAELTFATATDVDAEAIAALRTAAAERLTRTVGKGHWSRIVTERGVRNDLKIARVLVARRGADIVATTNLATKKPWAIDLAYFTVVPRAVYLHEMAVAPDLQRTGIGRALVREGINVARECAADLLRADADGRRPAKSNGNQRDASLSEGGPATSEGVHDRGWFKSRAPHCKSVSTCRYSDLCEGTCGGGI